MAQNKPAECVSFEKLDEHIALITINRPEARNAINRDVAGGIAELVRQTEADSAIRAVVLTGAGDKAFCAGADLKEVAAGGLGALFTQGGGLAGLVLAQRRKPWIAAVNGFAFAGGCELALSCDLIVASDNAAFSLPEVKRSLVAGAGGVYRLVRSIPRNIAMEYILTGKAFSASQAQAWGMINRLVHPSSLISEALTLAHEIAANAPLAVAESLAIAQRAFDEHDDTLAHACLRALDRLATTEDFQEGPRAFVEKREPRWLGR